MDSVQPGRRAEATRGGLLEGAGVRGSLTGALRFYLHALLVAVPAGVALLPGVARGAESTPESSDAAAPEASPSEGESGTPPAEGEAEANAEASAEVSTDDVAPPSDENEGPPPTLLEASAGVRLYSRSFTYSDTLAQTIPASGYADLPSYGLSAAPMPYVELDLFPLAKSSSAVLQNIGVVGGFEMGIATDINYQGTKLNQTHYRYHVGLKGRVPLGRISIQPTVEFGGHEFSIRAPAGVTVPFPSVNYSMLEAGSELVWKSHPITIVAYGKFLLPLSLGDVGSGAWFPSAKALGTHWGGQVGFAVSSAFDVLVNFDARIYGLNFNPVSDMASPDKVAGGATDQYVSASLGIGYHFPSPAPSD